MFGKRLVLRNNSIPSCVVINSAYQIGYGRYRRKYLVRLYRLNESAEGNNTAGLDVNPAQSSASKPQRGIWGLGDPSSLIFKQASVSVAPKSLQHFSQRTSVSVQAATAL